MSIRINFAGIAICIGIASWAAPAHADYFTSWVATTCDQHSGRAIVRFGYADADDPPLFFVPAEPSFDGGMSATPATNASQEEAACKLSNGREVKIRRGGGDVDQYSIWVDGIRIAHDQIVIDKLPFEFIIDPEGFRPCMFQVQSGDIYDVTSAARKPHPTPIHCDPTLTPISGNRDLIEYPADPRTPKPEAGSIIVSKANAPFCDALILPAPPNANFKFYVGVPETLGKALGPAESSAPVYVWPSVGGDTTHVSSVPFDFWGTGQKTQVYLFDSGRTLTDEFIVVPDSGTTQDEVLRMATSAGDWVSAQQAARARGWNVYTGAGTPYDQTGYVNIVPARIKGSSYLFFSSSRAGADPTSVLMKAQRGGKLTTVCVFEEVRAHF